MYFNAGDLYLTVDKVNIKNGIFQKFKTVDRDASIHISIHCHLRFERLTGNLTNVSFIKDTIKANIDLAAKERSGFELRKLKTSFKLTPQIMEFAKLELVTPKSRLQNYFAMRL